MLRLASRLVLIAGSVAVGAAGAAALRADLIVGYGMNRALEARQTPATFELAKGPAHGATQSSAEVGDEGYWLSGTAVASPVLLGKRLAVGDHIVISAQDRSARRLQVVDISPVETPLHAVADVDAPLRLVRVTCRVVGHGAGNDEVVRFFVEAEAPKSVILPSPAPRGVALGRT